MTLTAFPPPPSGADHNDLRQEVRAFLAEELSDFPPEKRAKSWNGFSRDFSRKLAQRGWVGMTFPEEYGGHARSALERYVVSEELLAAGADKVFTISGATGAGIPELLDGVLGYLPDRTSTETHAEEVEDEDDTAE